jgi:tryptophan 2,3-dioxygenase
LKLSSPGVHPPVYYADYLGLDMVLNAQHPLSKLSPSDVSPALAPHVNDGGFAHDEHLFIVTHQAYELWFKQIIVELGSCLRLFDMGNKDNCLPERCLAVVLARLRRIVAILKLLVSQISIIETMDPRNFLEFREYISPASGFQSAQFRIVENLLGLSSKVRLTFQSTDYKKFFSAADAETLSNVEKQQSLLKCIETWLERTPFLQFAQFDFWSHYQSAVSSMLAKQRTELEAYSLFNDEDRERHVRALDQQAAYFDMLFDEKAYEEYRRSQATEHLSYRAMQAAILIRLYHDEPAFHLPNQLLEVLVEMDEWLNMWRHRHVLMVQRMIGVKRGTGGSSGYQYLRSTEADRYKVFIDLTQLATTFVKRSALPDLPANVASHMDYRYADVTKSRRSSTT